MMTIFSLLIGIIVLFGSVVSVLSAFGILRLPDVYLRSHAATKSTTLGILCILVGSFLFFLIFEGDISARLLLGILFVFITAPVAGHLNARAAYRTNVPQWKGTIQDALTPVLRGKKRVLLEKEEVSVDGNNEQKSHE